MVRNWSPRWARSGVLRLLLLLLLPFLGSNLRGSTFLRPSASPYTTWQPLHTLPSSPNRSSSRSTSLYDFPRWDSGGIDLEPLVALLHGVWNHSASTVAHAKPRRRFPETLYVVDRRGVWVSRTLRQRTLPGMVKARVRPTEQLFLAAWRKGLAAAEERWPHLYRASREGVPFLAWYGDYKACNHHNWKERWSIPILTVCASVHCQYAFPIPNYRTIGMAKDSTNEWTLELERNARNYPQEHQRRQVVWRGSLSASNENFTDVRWRLCRQVQGSHLFDVGLVSIPSRHDAQHLNLSSVGGLKPPIYPMRDFQKYMGILDMDGNSWSSRFGELLCYNSVVLKVEPQYVDYFHFQGLAAWEHYIPVKQDLTDLMEAA